MKSEVLIVVTEVGDGFDLLEPLPQFSSLVIEIIIDIHIFFC